MPTDRALDGATPEVSTERTERVDRLIQMGLNRDQALAVVLGRRDLNDYLRRLAATAKKSKLERQYGLAPSVAMQVALGQADLNETLRRNRRSAHLAENRHRTVLAPGETVLVLAVHGQAWRTGRIRGASAYEVELETTDGQVMTLHKCDVKFAFESAFDRDFKRMQRTDTELYAAPRQPVRRPQERLKISDRCWFDWLDEETPVRLTTLEGEVLEGLVAWISRYEVALKMKRDVEVVVLRHALASVDA
jgi:sRNA-binding regulator protein Hfq